MVRLFALAFAGAGAIFCLQGCGGSGDDDSGETTPTPEDFSKTTSGRVTTATVAPVTTSTATPTTTSATAPTTVTTSTAAEVTCTADPTAQVPNVVFRNLCDFPILVRKWDVTVTAGETACISSPRPSDNRIQWVRADADRFKGDFDWQDDFIELNFDWQGPGHDWTGYPTYSNYPGINMASKYEARDPDDGSLACDEAGAAFTCDPDSCPTQTGPNGLLCEGDSGCGAFADWSEECSFAINGDGTWTETFKNGNYVNYPCAESGWDEARWQKYNGKERSMGSCVDDKMRFNFWITTCSVEPDREMNATAYVTA